MEEKPTEAKPRPSSVLRGISDWFTYFFLGFPNYSAGKFAQGNSEHRYSYNSFIVSKRHIREVTNVMTAALSDAANGDMPVYCISISTSQLNKVVFDNAESLLQFFNPRHDQIVRLAITASTPDRSLVAYAEFRNIDAGWSTAAIVEGGTYDQSQRLIERLTPIVADTHQWYSPISNNRGWRWAAGILAVIGITLAFLLPFWPQYEDAGHIATHEDSAKSNHQAPISDPQSFKEKEGLPLVQILVINLIEAVVVFLVFFVRGWLYPKGVFLIGKGIDRHRQLLVARRLVISGILIPIGFKIWDCNG